MWNLIYLQLLIEELGHRVVNLGACVPDDLLVGECRRLMPDLVVLSSVNGHGFHDGVRVAPLLRGCAELAGTAIVIGGKLGIDGARSISRRWQLVSAGFDRAFDDGDVDAFREFLRWFSTRVA